MRSAFYSCRNVQNSFLKKEEVFLRVMKGPSGRPTSAEAAWSIVQERPRGTLDSRVKRRVEEVSSGSGKHLSKASSIDKEDNEG